MHHRWNIVCSACSQEGRPFGSFQGSGCRLAQLLSCSSAPLTRFRRSRAVRRASRYSLISRPCRSPAAVPPVLCRSWKTLRPLAQLCLPLCGTTRTAPGIPRHLAAPWPRCGTPQSLSHSDDLWPTSHRYMMNNPACFQPAHAGSCESAVRYSNSSTDAAATAARMPSDGKRRVHFQIQSGPLGSWRPLRGRSDRHACSRRPE